MYTKAHAFANDQENSIVGYNHMTELEKAKTRNVQLVSEPMCCARLTTNGISQVNVP